MTLVKGPKHGRLELGEIGGAYLPNSGYIGRDSATFLVEIGGYRVKVVYALNVLNHPVGGTEGYDPYEDEKNCPKGEHWKISLDSTDPIPMSARNSPDFLSR